MRIFKHSSDGGQGVGFVEDAEVAIVAGAERRDFLTQYPRAGRMEGADPWHSGSGADQHRYPIAHLVGGLVGEGYREDAVGSGVALGHQVGDTITQHAGLAGAGAGENQGRAVRRQDRFALRGIEVVEIQ